MGNTIQQVRNSDASPMLERNQMHPLLWNKKGSSMEANQTTILILSLLFWLFIPPRVFTSYCKMYNYCMPHIHTVCLLSSHCQRHARKWVFFLYHLVLLVAIHALHLPCNLSDLLVPQPLNWEFFREETKDFSLCFDTSCPSIPQMLPATQTSQRLHKPAHTPVSTVFFIRRSKGFASLLASSGEENCSDKTTRKGWGSKHIGVHLCNAPY